MLQHLEPSVKSIWKIFERLLKYHDICIDRTQFFYLFQDEASCGLSASARDALRRLGSRQGHQLGWRDTWVLVAVKPNNTGAAGDSAAMATGDELPDTAMAEQLNKSPNVHSWASDIVLRVEVPLTGVNGKYACILTLLRNFESL